MRGSPVYRLVFVSVAFALMLIPLLRLTSGPRESVPAQMEPGAGRTPTRLVVRFAHRPDSLTLRHQGEVVLAKERPNSPCEVDAEFTIPAEGLELELSCAWSADAPETAVTVELTPDGMDSRSQTRWAQGSMTEILDFRWR